MGILMLCLLTSVAGCFSARANKQKELSFTIDKTWDGKTIPDSETVHIVLKGVENSQDVKMSIDAPFYNDPAPNGQPGQPFYGLWDYEVVEAFFLNDKNQYLEVEVGPHRQHIVLLLNGARSPIRHSLSLDVTTTIKGSRWVGEAIIPGDYLPPQVTKFNAYAIHGVDTERQYLSLYPTDGTTAQPDFHNLAFFRPIDMKLLNSLHGSNTKLSTIWTSAIRESNEANSP